ncbi:MAG: glycosyltransferase family 2 protein [Candidatus Levybacteria bacterium]|nr:glycosyltransferase family 2 protein [Candidatus Levybacteria bacterium]
MNKELISIIIPAYNEERNINKVLLKLKKLKKILNLEVIVVDDGSSDQTVKVAKQNADIVVRLKKNKGKGGAFIAGIQKSKGKYVIQIDADDQFQVKDIPKFLDKLNEGYQVVLGTRFDKGNIEKGSVSIVNLFGNWLMSQTTIFFSGIHITDIMAGFKGFTRDSLKKMQLSTNHFGYEAEVIVKAGKLNLRVAEVPITYKKRLFGTSSVHALKDGIKVISTIAKMYFTFPGQSPGQGIVGKRIIMILTPLWFTIVLPLFSIIHYKDISLILAQTTISIAVFIAIGYYAKSKIAAYISSALVASAPLYVYSLTGNYSDIFYFGGNNPGYLIIILLFLTSIYFYFLSKSQWKIIIYSSIVGFLFTSLGIFFGKGIEVYLIYLLALCYIIYRKSEPQVSHLLAISFVLAVGNSMSQNLILGIFAIAIGMGGIVANVFLEIVSFKSDKSPLFSLFRIIKVIILLIFTLSIFMSIIWKTY